MTEHPMTDEAPSLADQVSIIHQNGGRQETILNILLALQEASGAGYIDAPTISLVADELRMSETRVYEIASFYSMIKTQPQARHVLQLCDSTPCYFSGATDVAGWLESKLGVKTGETTADGDFSVERVSCFGACDVGPAIKIGDVVYGDLTEKKAGELIDELRRDKTARVGD